MNAQTITIVKEKKFHHDNLILRLQLHEQMNALTISIYRANDRSEHDLWGIYCADEPKRVAAAHAKFESIVL